MSAGSDHPQENAEPTTPESDPEHDDLDQLKMGEAEHHLPYHNLEEDDEEEEEQPAAATSHWASGGYERQVIDSVWQFAEIVAGNDPALWRKDEFGAWINRLDYGRRHSQFGWEICDVAGSRSATGITALRPMQWQNYLDQVAAITQSRVTAEGKHNVRRLL